jgi:hypothetical protein
MRAAGYRKQQQPSHAAKKDKKLTRPFGPVHRILYIQNAILLFDRSLQALLELNECPRAKAEEGA